MKLCYVSGNVPLAIKLMITMVKYGHEVHWIPIGDFYDTPKGVTIHNNIKIKDKNLILTLSTVFLNIFRIIYLIKMIKPDVLHAMNVKWAGWYSSLSNFSPFVVTALGQDVMISQDCDMDFIRKNLRSYVINKSDALTYGSNTMLHDIKIWGTAKQFFRYYQGIDFQIYNFNIENKFLLDRLKLNDYKIVFSPRMFTENSNLDVLIKSIPIVKSYIPDVKFVFVCHLETDNYSVKMKNLIKDLDIVNDCIFLDRIEKEEMPVFYSISKVVVSILESDGMPATIIESMAMKIPLVVSEIPTYKELSVNNTMLFAKIRDVESTADKIIKSINMDQSELIQNAYQWVEEHGQSKVLNKNLENLYKNLIN
jgi:glycosyltransferase involved in cell wall biosynthesis